MFNCAKAARSHSHRADLAARGSRALARAKGCDSANSVQRLSFSFADTDETRGPALKD
jgi:hypothetical protein